MNLSVVIMDVFKHQGSGVGDETSIAPVLVEVI